MREGLLKIAAIFSYCGGPLFIADLLKPRWGAGLAYWRAARRWTSRGRSPHPVSTDPIEPS